jgi:hypothetical protein
VAGEEGFGDECAGVVAGGRGFEDCAVGGVGEESAPGAVGGDAAGHVGGDGAVAGEFAGVVVHAEERGDGDEDLDVRASAVLVGQAAAEPVESVVQHVFEQVRHGVRAPLFRGPLRLCGSLVYSRRLGVRLLRVGLLGTVLADAWTADAWLVHGWLPHVELPRG